MDQKIKTICLEVGLAIALVVSLSLLGAKMGSEHQKKEAKLELAEANPLVYVHGGYYNLGEKIGKFGWSVEKKKT